MLLPPAHGIKLERLWYEYDRHRWRFATLDVSLALYKPPSTPRN